MALSTCSVTTNVIASLGTTVQERGLTTDQFKAKFDKEATDIVAWLNDTHIPELKQLGVMTTQGDMVYRDASEVARLAKGTALQALVMNAAANAPQWMTIPQIKIGSFTRDTSLASGSQAITGVGFAPRVLIFLMSVAGLTGMSIGFDDATTHLTVTDNYSALVNTWASNLSYSILFIAGGGSFYGGAVSSMDADGFTVTWTKGTTPTGTATVEYLALK